MKKTYFVKMLEKKNSANQKTFFYHKPIFWTKKDMIENIGSLYPDYVFQDIKRIT